MNRKSGELEANKGWASWELVNLGEGRGAAVEKKEQDLLSSRLKGEIPYNSINRLTVE